jgi:hypothetical protein
MPVALERVPVSTARPLRVTVQVLAAKEAMQP